MAADWMASAAQWIGDALALAAAAVSFGVLRQRVNGMQAQLNEQNRRIDKLVDAVEKVGETKNALELLKQSVEYSHQAILAQATHAEELAAERTDGLRSEVRSFMQGQATGERRARQQPS